MLKDKNDYPASLLRHASRGTIFRCGLTERLIAPPPALVLRRSQNNSPQLTSWGRHLLTGYAIGDGYALRRASPAPISSKEPAE